MKKIGKIILAIVLLAIIGGAIYINALMPVITGYAAKNLASAVFISGRTQESMENENLNFSFIKLTNNTVDFENKTVTSHFLWSQSTAIFTEDFGCSLIKEIDAESYKSKLPKIDRSLSYNPDTVAWPLGNIMPDSIPQGIDMKKINTITDNVFSNTGDLNGTFGFMVLYKGVPVMERYRKDFNQSTRFLSWSMAKSLTSTLIGLRSDQGKLDINAPLPVEEWQADERKNITMKNLLQMNSGLEWNEDYGNLSDVTVMLHKVGDFAKYTWDKALTYPVGTQYYYSSGTTNLASHFLRSTFNSDKDYYAFPYEQLFKKIGINNNYFETDNVGTYVGSSYWYATIRDYARYGLLYANKGYFAGQQILSDEWIKFTNTPAEGSDNYYTAFFRINLCKDFANAPEDMLSCRGHNGQAIFIIPSKELVIVRTGYSPNRSFGFSEMLDGVLDAVE